MSKSREFSWLFLLVIQLTLLKRMVHSDVNYGHLTKGKSIMKKVLFLGVIFLCIVGIVIHKNNLVADNLWDALHPGKNPTGYIEGFQTIMSGGDIKPGDQAVIQGIIKNQNTNYLDIQDYTVEYEPTSIGPLSGPASKWTGGLIPYNYQEDKKIISSSCFKMPVHLSIGGTTIEGTRIPIKDRIYGNEIDNKCINKNLTITLKGSRQGYGTDELGVLIELGNAYNKLLDYEEYFYTIDGALKWHKKNGALQ